jgi:hypothetical protein
MVEEEAVEETQPAPAGHSQRGLKSLKDLLPLVDESDNDNKDE